MTIFSLLKISFTKAGNRNSTKLPLSNRQLFQLADRPHDLPYCNVVTLMEDFSLIGVRASTPQSQDQHVATY